MENSLVTSFRAHNCIKKRKTPVTIIVGIICKQAIVLASDSQTSYGSSKRTDTDKISMINFGASDKILVAQSGNAELSSRAVEEFEKLSKNAQFDDYRKPVEVLEEALRALKQNVIYLNNWQSSQDYSNEFFKDIDNNFGLMVAYYHGDPPVPYIYIVNFWPGIASRQRGYATLGCGSTVAEFILSRSKVSEMDSGMATMTAIYTVEEVKKVDAFCGGQTKVAVLTEKGERVSTEHQKRLDLVNSVVESMSKYEEETRAAWKAMMNTVAEEAVENFNKKHPNKKFAP
jgi:20S proteasome alpha/beta subunit